MTTTQECTLPEIHQQLVQASTNNRVAEHIFTNSDKLQAVEHGVWMTSPSREDTLFCHGTPLKQLCSRLHIPYNFFKKNPIQTQQRLLDTWFPTIDGKEFILKDKLDKNTAGARALLPKKHVHISNAEIVASVAEAFQASGTPLKKVIHVGDNDAVILLRPITNLDLDVSSEVGEKLDFGITIKMSETGLSPLSLDLLIFREVCVNGLVVSYENESFFHNRYQQISADSVFAVIRALVDNLNKLRPVVQNTLQKALYGARTKSVENMEEFATALKRSRLNGKILKEAKIAAAEEEDNNVWSFLNHVTQKAQKFDPVRCERAERAVSKALHLSLPKAA